MGLDTFIFKTTKKEAINKVSNIIKTKEKAMKQSYNDPETGFVFITGNNLNYMDKLTPDIYWRKFNHITAWFSEKIFCNPSNCLENNLDIVSTEELKELRRDCSKVVEHCTMPDGSLKIDKKYCRRIFPCLYLPFSGNPEYDELFIDELKTAMSNIDILLLSSWNPDNVFIIYADY